MSQVIELLAAALGDRYAVESEIGHGGMATVFLAEDLKHHRRVAIKVLHPELAAIVGADRFLQEIRTVAGLTHPHILALHDSGEAEGLLYYVMPYIEGDSLRQRLERERQLPVEEAVRIACDVASALHHAHTGGVVHRDVKPGNILFSGGEAVLADFGIAWAVSTAKDERLTQTGLSLGTPAYMSPEQSGGERQIDGRSDMYGLACVLYEMLVGTPPFTARTSLALRARHSSDPVPAMRGVRATVPAGLEEAVTRALAKVPADRFRTVAEFGDALEDCLGTATAHPAAPAEDRKQSSASIAVLPFADMSPGRDQEYFSDGISEELLNLLGKIPGLRVAARTSSFTFKGQNLEIPEIARRLNVAHILEGAVRKAGNQVRITAQLVRADDGFHSGSETWYRTLEDIFAIQDEIAADVAEQLKVTLLGAGPKAQETDPAAYALFLQARQLGRQATAESLEQSNVLYQQALEIDSGYAAALTGLASNYRFQVILALRPIDEGFGLAREAANRALAIDPESALARSVLGLIASDYDNDLAAAARHAQRALELAPTDTDILLTAAFLARHLGRLDESIALCEFAVAHDPVNSDGYAGLGFAYLVDGRLDDATASLRSGLRLSPGRIGAQFGIGLTLLEKAEPEAALAAMQQESNEGYRLIGLTLAYHMLGRTAESDAMLDELIDKYAQDRAHNIAYVLAFRGEVDRAFEWLEKAVQNNDPGMSVIGAHTVFANIQADPRWLPFLASIGRSPAQLAAIEFDVRLQK